MNQNTTADKLLRDYEDFLQTLAEAGIDFNDSQYHSGMEAGLAVSARTAGVSDEELFELRDVYYAELWRGSK